MRIKTLLIAGAALASGIISSQAQVYSQNIVGYVNQVLPANAYTLINNPLLGASTNAEQVISSIQVGDTLLQWNGVNYNAFVYFGPGTWQEPDGSFGAAPNLVPGSGFYFQGTAGVLETNTFVGTVLNTNAIALPANSYNFVGSSIPYAGTAESTNLNLPLQVGDTILEWNGTGNYNSYVFFGPGTWQEPDGSFGTAPNINVGQGFIYQTSAGVSENWTENLNVQ